MLAPEVESLPWEEQLALDDYAYRDQLAYLFERSGFYRAKTRKLLSMSCGESSTTNRSRSKSHYRFQQRRRRPIPKR